ncbi:MAG: hypothetical protein P8184_20505, partial [Calditrichia bacterium]
QPDFGERANGLLACSCDEFMGKERTSEAGIFMLGGSTVLPRQSGGIIKPVPIRIRAKHVLKWGISTKQVCPGILQADI